MKSQEVHPPQTRPKVNAPSSMLTQDENEVVFKLLGRKCQSLNTAVVQIYRTEGSAHSHWKKKHTGVVCFIKDNAIRSYFLRAYCLIKNELIWEHELYETMKIVKARPFLLTFEGQDGHVGLNFVSEEECDTFYRVADATIETRNKKKLEKRGRLKSQAAPNIPQSVPKDANKTTFSAQTASEPRVQMRNHPKIAPIAVNAAPPVASAPSKNFLTGGFSLTSSSNKDKKRKITKADIGTPTNFTHVSHVGWNADKGFDMKGDENDEVLSYFFAKAGVSENELNDRDTRAFIYDFIQTNNVLASVKSERIESPKEATQPVTQVAPPPPVPSRHQHHQNGGTQQRSAPPPPPARQAPPPVPTTMPGGTRAPAPPIRPPPLNAATLPPPAATAVPAATVAPAAPPAVAIVTAPPAPPPPPPPPPPMPSLVISAAPASTPIAANSSVVAGAPRAPNEPGHPSSSLPAVSDPRNALMESIRKGITLKKVDASTLSTGSGDSRSELMSEIRMGIELRPAQNRELAAHRISDDIGGTDALADALRRALQERGRVIQSSDEDSDSSCNDDEWDD